MKKRPSRHQSDQWHLRRLALGVAMSEFTGYNIVAAISNPLLPLLLVNHYPSLQILTVVVDFISESLIPQHSDSRLWQ
ncbi:unnamed protein product [Cuscuta campestris]|uniref:Uncharacterized protein n=1 Tax=Cuscuta campestris TaxID=132261 RepID=A0A484LKK3_9ASTE|nr:unnamed protein product [Cuscuta campestris]